MTLAMLLLAACGTTPVVQPGAPSSEPTTPALVGEPSLLPGLALGATTTSSTTTTSTCITTTNTSTTTPTTTTSSTTSSTTTTTPTSTSTTLTSTYTTTNTTTTTTTTTSPPVPPALSLCRLDWVESVQSPSSVRDVSVVRTPDGGTLVAGTFDYSVTLAAGTPEETTLQAMFLADTLIAKYSVAGVLEWTAQVSGNDGMLSRGIVVNASGTIAVTGWMMSDAEFIPTSTGVPMTLVHQSQGIAPDQYVATLNPQGQFLWVNSVAGPTTVATSVEGGGIAIADDGTVYVNGTFSGPSDPTVGINPPGPLLSNQTSTWHAFVARFEADGSPGWGRVIGGTHTEKGLGLTLDDLGNVVVMGEFNETLVVSQGEPDEQTFAPPMQYSSVQNMYMASYSPTGDLVWARTGGSDEGVMQPGNVAAGAGVSLLAGAAGFSSVFGAGEPNEFAMGPDYSGYVAAYEGDGTFAYGRYIGSPPDRLNILGVAMTPLGAIAVGGFVNGPFNFPMPNGAPPVTRNTPGFSGAVFTATYLPNGDLQCLLTQTATGDLIDNRVSALSYDGEDGLYVVGTYDALLTFDGVSPAVVLDAGLGQDAFVAHYTLEAP